MKLHLYNYTMTPGTVTQIIHQEDRVVVKKLNISEKGVYNPVTGFMKIGSLYPTPKGNLPIKSITNGCIEF